MCHRVTQNSGWEILDPILQGGGGQLDNHKLGVLSTKADILEGDPGCSNLVASNVYDTKPVHYRSMVLESIEWVETKRKFTILIQMKLKVLSS